MIPALCALAAALAAVLALLLVRRHVGQSLAERLGTLASRLSALDGGGVPGLDPGTIPSLRARCAHLQWRLPKQLESRKLLLFREFGAEVAILESALASVESGCDPLAAAPGVTLRAFRSGVDGDLAIYSLRVPDGYRRDRSWPLVVHLHGRGPLEPFTGHPAPDYGGEVLVLSPYGRGSVDYMGPAEADVLGAIAEVQRLCSVDADRVYLAGASMGGTGSWHLAVHYPDRFAALVAASANSDDRVWEDLWESPPVEPPARGSVGAVLKRMERLDSPVTYAANLLHVAARVIHGEADQVVPVEHARRMVEALQSAGASVEYEEQPSVEHNVGYGETRELQADWLLTHRREARPRVVRYATDGRWAGAYWVRRVDPCAPLDLAEVRAEAGPGGAIAVTTSGCGALELDLTAAPVDGTDRIEVSIDGRILGAFGRAPAAFVNGSGGWQPAERLPPHAPREFSRVFWGPFAIVYGTRGSDADLREALRREAERLAAEWRRRYFSSPRLLADDEAGEAVLKSCGLVLFGGPAENAVTERAMRELRDGGRAAPFEFAGGGVSLRGSPCAVPDATTLGLQFVWPSPFNPERSIAVVWGASWRALVDVNGRFGNTFDWTVYENRRWFGYALYDEKTANPESFLRVGLFEPDWSIGEKLSWARPPGTERELPGGAPRLRSAAECSEPQLWLDSLVPSATRQLRGPVGFGRGWHGNRLRAGREGLSFDRGIGVRAPSRLFYEIGGRFRRFRAAVGADLDGRRPEELTEPRLKYGRMRFIVRGDGRALYAGDPLGPADPPVDIDVDVRGVGLLELEVAVADKYDWHLGPAAWGDARLER